MAKEILWDIMTLELIAPWGYHSDFRCAILKCSVVIIFISTSSAIVFMQMEQDPTDDESTLVQVMAWHLKAISYYVNQCWPRSLMSYGIT